MSNDINNYNQYNKINFLGKASISKEFNKPINTDVSFEQDDVGCCASDDGVYGRAMLGICQGKDIYGLEQKPTAESDKSQILRKDAQLERTIKSIDEFKKDPEKVDLLMTLYDELLKVGMLPREAMFVTESLTSKGTYQG